MTTAPEPLTTRVLLRLAVPRPSINAFPWKFQVVPALTDTLLLEEPMPIVVTPLKSVASVTVIVLKPEPEPPTVTAPLVTVLPPRTL
ncbi:MAG: hypothetical protein PCFJNLEI_04155 [Verrucomicrobiae bacterium]|nr:hypothetical protein [Verrucomicrobiae bacterium]